MTLRLTFFCGLLALGGLALGGCVPSAQSQSDEEKESHFLAGKSRVSTMDYEGAVEAFEKALEVNPRSGAAHFELGCLYDQQEVDPAAAIYHYEKYLNLRPDAGNADVVRQRINTCKQELARNVSLGPLSERQQRELEMLAQKNKELEKENKRLSELVENWQAYATRLQARTNATWRRDARPGPLPTAAPDTSTRTHTVKSGETLVAIARQYGIRLEALIAANPDVNPRRMPVGHVLRIPTP